MAVNINASVERPNTAITKVIAPANSNNILTRPLTRTSTNVNNTIVNNTNANNTNANNQSAILYKTAIIPTATAVVKSVSAIQQPSRSIGKYILIAIILLFMIGSLILFINKPADTKINAMYDPIINLFKPSDAVVGKLNVDSVVDKNDENNTKKEKDASVDKIKTAIDEKRIKNQEHIKSADKALNIQSGSVQKRAIEVPVPYIDTTLLPKKDKSKKGFCFIGEDRGARSCIEAGTGDVCMSGDIFPSMDICINPKLRE